MIGRQHRGATQDPRLAPNWTAVTCLHAVARNLKGMGVNRGREGRFIVTRTMKRNNQVYGSVLRAEASDMSPPRPVTDPPKLTLGLRQASVGRTKSWTSAGALESMEVLCAASRY